MSCLTKRLTGSICGLIMGMAAIMPVQSQTVDQFAAANADYAAGRFKEAIDKYEALVRDGEWSANLFYNLGNGYFRSGDLGHAILNYERALALEPQHPEAQANLRIARDQARALELPQTLPERYLHGINSRHYTIASAIVLWAGIFGLATLIVSRRRTIAVAAFTVLAFATSAGLVAAVYLHETASGGRAKAIVTASAVEARVATADTANSILALPPGSEIKILSQRGDWVYAALPNNLRGWLPAKSAESVRL